MPRTQRHIGYRLAGAGLFFIALLTLIPDPGATARAALTPVYCVICGDLGGVDFLLNILLFIPLGLGLGLAGFSWRRALVLAGLVSFSVELLQMKVVVGRDASLGDVFTNATGGAVGALLGAYWRRVVQPPPVPARILALSWAVCLIVIWAGTAWALGPAFPRGAAWYGAWAPELKSFDRFLGRPLMVTAGGEPLLPGGPALDQERLEDAVTARPSIAFRAILAERPHGLAPIAMIVDQWHRDVMLIGQERQDLALRINMRASILKLRTPTVNLRSGMAGRPGDTVEAEGGLRDAAFELTSRIGGELRTRRLPLSVSWGWSLVTPWSSVLGEEVRSLTAFWIIGLVAILAYWSVLAGGGSLVIPPVTILVLLGGIPWAASFPPAHWTEWMAALLGICLGLLAARPAHRARARMAQMEYAEEPPMHAQVPA